jgi:hypothetical protein
LNSSIGVHRTGGRYDLAAARDAFERFGVVILCGYLPAATREQLRAILDRKLANLANQSAILRLKDYPKADFLLGDVLAIRELEPFDCIFFGAEAVEMIKGLLRTDELLYWGDSSIQAGEAARGFHKDNVDRNDGTRDDWRRNYELVRCGFYMQDHTRHSGGLKVRLGSHNIPDHRGGRIADVETVYGDLVIWNMRLTHSGNNRKLRFPSGLALHPRLEGRIPSVLAAPEQMRRMAAFCSFGRPGSHLDRYIERMNEREKDYKPYFQFARNRREAAQLLRGRGVSFRLPNEYYGELDS